MRVRDWQIGEKRKKEQEEETLTLISLAMNKKRRKFMRSKLYQLM